MSASPADELTPAEFADFRRLAGIMVPASGPHHLPGADDETIFADIVRSLGRDRVAVRKALAALSEHAGGAFSDLDPQTAETKAMSFLDQGGPLTVALGRAVLQCYYRADAVMRAHGLEPRAPFPKGHTTPQGDWSLLDPVRTRPRMWRDTDDRGR